MLGRSETIDLRLIALVGVKLKLKPTTEDISRKVMRLWKISQPIDNYYIWFQRTLPW